EGHGGVRPRRALRRGGARDGRLDGAGQAQEPRGHRRGAGDLPRDAAQAVQGREHRQAGVESRGGMTMKTITVTRTIPAPIEKVFDLLADHANYKKHFGVKESKLIKEGKPDKN